MITKDRGFEFFEKSGFDNFQKAMRASFCSYLFRLVLASTLFTRSDHKPLEIPEWFESVSVTDRQSVEYIIKTRVNVSEQEKYLQAIPYLENLKSMLQHFPSHELDDYLKKIKIHINYVPSTRIIANADTLDVYTAYIDQRIGLISPDIIAFSSVSDFKKLKTMCHEFLHWLRDEFSESKSGSTNLYDFLPHLEQGSADLFSFDFMINSGLLKFNQKKKTFHFKEREYTANQLLSEFNFGSEMYVSAILASSMFGDIPNYLHTLIKDPRFGENIIGQLFPDTTNHEIFKLFKKSPDDSYTRNDIFSILQVVNSKIPNGIQKSWESFCTLNPAHSEVFSAIGRISFLDGYPIFETSSGDHTVIMPVPVTEGASKSISFILNYDFNWMLDKQYVQDKVIPDLASFVFSFLKMEFSWNYFPAHVVLKKEYHISEESMLMLWEIVNEAVRQMNK